MDFPNIIHRHNNPAENLNATGNNEFKNVILYNNFTYVQFKTCFKYFKITHDFVRQIAVYSHKIQRSFFQFTTTRGIFKLFRSTSFVPILKYLSAKSPEIRIGNLSTNCAYSWKLPEFLRGTVYMYKLIGNLFSCCVVGMLECLENWIRLILSLSDVHQRHRIRIFSVSLTVLLMLTLIEVVVQHISKNNTKRLMYRDVAC